MPAASERRDTRTAERRDPSLVPSISAVVPMFNEEENAAPFLRALADSLAALTHSFEIVVVNDGSRDGTREAALALGRACRLQYVELSRNFGKEAALTAGLEAARGDVVVILDADFQHPLACLAPMLERWREGFDMVYAVRESRRDESLAKRAGTALFYWLLERGSQVAIPAGAGDFRLMDRKVVAALLRLPERSRFMKGLYAWVGFRSIPFPYEAQPRAAGQSSFSFRRLASLAFAGLTAFSYLPLRAISGLGVIVSLGALGYGGWVAVEALLFGSNVPGYPTIVVSIMFFSGVQLLSLGVVGEYLARVFEEVKQRPGFVVADAADFSELPPRQPPRS
jgi:glycosyltransferase involved in cell wall biosynthesis